MTEPLESAMLALLDYLNDLSPSAPMRVPGVAFDTSAAEWVAIDIMRTRGAPARAGRRYEHVAVMADAIVRNSSDFVRAYELADEISGYLSGALITFTSGAESLALRIYEPQRDGILPPEEAGEDAIALRLECDAIMETAL